MRDRPVPAQVTALEERLAAERSAREAVEELARARADELSAMRDELGRAHARLVQQEKLASLGRMVAEIAHELSNPIGFVRGNTEFLARYVEDLLALVEVVQAGSPRLDPELRAQLEAKEREIELDFVAADLRKVVRSIGIGARRAAELVRSIRSFSRCGGTEMDEVDVAVMLKTVVELVAPLARDRITVALDVDPTLPRIRCRPSHLDQVFMNLLTNAVQAIPDTGRIDVLVRAVGEDRQLAEVTVRDTGVGMSPDVVRAIFEPFFTTKPVGEGTGLGLAICERIVRAHGGSIACASEPGLGTTFTVTLPVQPREG